jgi:hypothetical protein
MRRRPGPSPAKAMVAALLAAGTSLLGSATLAAPALAGRYHVYSCRTPDGEVAPTDGWTGSVTGAFDYDLNTCAEGGALIAGLGDDVSRDANADYATWTFNAPENEQLAGATLWRAGDTDGGSNEAATYLFSLAGPADTYDSANVFDNCVAFEGCAAQGTVGVPLSSANYKAVPAANLGSHLYVDAACGGENGSLCPNNAGDGIYDAAIYLYAADLLLEDTSPPLVTNTKGTLAEAPSIGATGDISFHASDTGSGLYTISFVVDGKLMTKRVMNSNFGRCADIGQTTDGLPAFLYLEPCPAELNVAESLDVTNLANGDHQLVVSVSDAAGNSTVVLDRTIVVDNITATEPTGTETTGSSSSSTLGAQSPTLTATNGANASSSARLIARWQSRKRSRLTINYGGRAVLVGRLTTSGGVPIVGAQLDLSATPSFDGARSVMMASPRTRAGGRFTVRLPHGVSSRTIHVAYRDQLSDTTPVAESTLALSVRAGLTLKITPRTAHVGTRITLRGGVLGGPVPPGGKLLVLEARSAKTSWLQFHVVSAGNHGRFHFVYRFRLRGPVRYRFRVVSKSEADFPFIAGSSKAVTVTER